MSDGRYQVSRSSDRLDTFELGLQGSYAQCLEPMCIHDGGKEIANLLFHAAFSRVHARKGRWNNKAGISWLIKKYRRLKPLI